MSTRDVLIIVAAHFAAIPLALAIIWAVGGLNGWRGLARRFPPAPIGPGARRGRFGYVSFGCGGYNGCVVWAADDEHLHLRLWSIFAIAGHPPMSIPWAAIEFHDAPGGRMVPVTIDGRRGWRLQKSMVERELAVRSAMAATAAPVEESAHVAASA